MSHKEETIKTLAFLLEEKRRKERWEEKTKGYEKVKDILIYLAFFGACVFAPNALKIFRPTLKLKNNSSWKSFNLGYLKWSLNRLSKQEIIEVKDGKEGKIITLTEKGEKKILKYALNDLEIAKPNKWDEKWRLVIYDIATRKKLLTESIRKTLVNLGFIAIQESVYLFPYPCEKEISLLRSYYNLDKEIKFITACKIEDERAYKTYFGLSQSK